MRRALLHLLPWFLGSLVWQAFRSLPLEPPDKKWEFLKRDLNFKKVIELEEGARNQVIPLYLGDFDLEAGIRAPAGGHLSLFLRCCPVRRGWEDFTEVRFSSGREDGLSLEPGKEHELLVRGRGRSLEVRLGGKVVGRFASRFSFGYTAMGGTGTIRDPRIRHLGPPRSAGRAYGLWMGLCFAITLTLFLHSFRRRWLLLPFGALLACAPPVFAELWLRWEPMRARAWDLLREGGEGEHLLAFGARRPFRSLDLAMGRFTDEFGRSFLAGKRGKRIALLGTGAASQDRSPPAERWYAFLRSGLSRRLQQEVEVLHGLHPGAVPSRMLEALAPFLKRAEVDLAVLLVAPEDLQSIPPDGPSTSGWSRFLLLNALGLARKEPFQAWAGETAAYEKASSAFRKSIPTLEMGEGEVLPLPGEGFDKAAFPGKLVQEISRELGKK